MNREDIIRMAREAGLGRYLWLDNEFVNGIGAMYQVTDETVMEMMERFAALVISHHVQETRVKPTASDREMLQQIAYQHGGIGDLSQTEFEFAALVAAHEREACAKMAELVAREIDDTNGTATYIAKAIRAKRVAV